jgi:hypothetical protein
VTIKVIVPKPLLKIFFFTFSYYAQIIEMLSTMDEAGRAAFRTQQLSLVPQGGPMRAAAVEGIDRMIEEARGIARTRAGAGGAGA